MAALNLTRTDINSYQPDPKKMVIPTRASRKPSNQIKPAHITTKSHLTKTYVTIIALLFITAALTATGLTLASERDHAVTVAQKVDKDFGDCLRGIWRHTTENGDELGCWPVEVLKAENKRK